MLAAIEQGTASLAANALRRKLLDVALNSPQFMRSLSEAAAEIRKAAKPDVTEATIEGYFERVVYARLRDIHLLFHPEKEVGVDLRRHVTRGRIDSRLGALVIEYKRPSLLKTAAQIDKALGQLGQYLVALGNKSEGPLVGLLTNGLVMIEVRAFHGSIQRSAVTSLDGKALLRLTRFVISLALTALTSKNLIRDFCGSATGGVLFNTARLLNLILAQNPKAKTDMLRSEWEQMFRLAHEDQSQQKRIEERRAALGQLFGIEVADATSEYRTLFALHTAYAILLKFLAYRVVSDVYFGKVPQDFRSLASASPTALRDFCNTLEDGEIFRQLGIVNLLEGDFFSWYCDRQQWTTALADSIREILVTLARYEEVTKIFLSDEVPDLFRELYQAAVPRVVRSSFGEFYTPYWLAESVLESAALKRGWRAIDPCCGSGTFVIAAIARLRRECARLDKQRLLKQIVSRVVAMDLNPLGVLTTRIHYFIHISDLIHESDESLVIPVFLGDAASIPEHIIVDGVDCLRYTLNTLKTPIDTILPVSLAVDTPSFMRLMLKYEHVIKAKDANGAVRLLMHGLPPNERTVFGVREKITTLTRNLISLEQSGWNGIWARILSNFLTTACLGRFTAVVGNPPWIDWKNLPAGYRERIKSMCIDRGLFSGAGRTGGINLNICALIAHVSMSNWLGDAGRLAFLMPRELANQASYEGWRRLAGKWRFIAFDDWSKAGHPFGETKEDFMTFVIAKGSAIGNSIPVVTYRKKRGGSKATEWKHAREASEHLELSKGLAGQIIPGSTAFTFASSRDELREFSLIAGECSYVGREGIEFYPQELLLFKFDGLGPRPGTAWLRNIQVEKAKYRIPHRRVLLETRYLYPLVKGPAIDVFRHNYDGLIVAFPYVTTDPLRPLSSDELRATSPLLLDYYNQHLETIERQTKFSDKIRGADPGEFYGLARTGPYSFADTYVAFRDNSKWCAVVVSSVAMPWNKEKRRFVFQNHAVSICERQDGSGFINEDEAHYICAILNTSVAQRFIDASSDERSYRIRPPIFVPLYDPNDKTHKALSIASRKAHIDSGRIGELRDEMEGLYLTLCQRRQTADNIDAAIARRRLAEIEREPSALVSGETLRRRLAELAR